eukprot:Sdes_comp20857_c0_seq1m17677
MRLKKQSNMGSFCWTFQSQHVQFLRMSTKNIFRHFSSFQKTHSNHQKFDVAIIGGGIIGCATAREIAFKFSGPQSETCAKKIVLLEKEKSLAAHQSGNNSGVIHAGIYYLPGSQKARFCVEGMDLMYKYLGNVNREREKVPFKKIGKLIVAVDESEIPALEKLYSRAQKNAVKDVSFLKSSSEITKLEKNIRGLAAILSPHTGIVDWKRVTDSFADDFIAAGGSIHLNRNVDEIVPLNGSKNDFSQGILLNCSSSNTTYSCKYLIVCAGVQSDKMAVMTGLNQVPKIIPVRGEYFTLKNPPSFLSTSTSTSTSSPQPPFTSRLIYPVPSPKFPFLGVHFTPTIHGDILLGPNAILAF